MRKLLIGALLLSACGAPFDGGTSAPEEFDARHAEAAYNAAVLAALAGELSVIETDTRATLDGALTIDGASVTFQDLVLEKKPFSPSGTATIEKDGHVASVSFSGSLDGTLTFDGSAAGTLRAEFPMNDSFCEAAASWAIRRALYGQGAAFTSGITVTDNGNGSFTIDGTETAGGATIDFDMVTIDVANLTITGTITLDDGNGNTAQIVFNGTTADISINGQLVATIDLTQIFGP